MALSDYERKMLEQLEAQLKGEDPKLAESLAPEDLHQTRMALSARHLVLGLIAAVSGLGIVAAGVATEFISVGVVGAVVVWLGLMYIIQGMSQVTVETGKASKVHKPTGRQAQDFMERQKRAFEQRRDEGRM
ncbi:DUF3040 domain-containing protein [Arcanobacterium buesumense]|uniref:DUF3040 domain-containing protein n=1 Tax=Arcanobacterium buesumense TaxID=2722751 RepID=A0A6H2EKP3_9ACTO|nr:DUF3040 domain-containing protein [Arcanobacterium buesumense]QJC21603.1 DUF3040 domain-containing protein [Arcanobacterium buesumense]